MGKLKPFIMEEVDIVGLVVGDSLDAPVLVASDDFFEYLEEEGYEDTIDLNEFILVTQDYIRTECEKI